MPGSNFYKALGISNIENEQLKQEKLKALYASQAAIADKLARDEDRKARAEEADKQRTFEGQKAQFDSGIKDKSFANALKVAEIGAGSREKIATGKNETALGVQRLRNQGGLDRQGLINSGNMNVQGLRNEGDMNVQGLRNEGAENVQNLRDMAAGERNNATLTSRENVAQLNSDTQTAINEKRMSNQSELAAARNEVQMKLGELASADRNRAIDLRAELQNAQNKLKALDLERKVLSDPMLDENKAQSILGRTPNFSQAVSPSFNSGSNAAPSAPASTRPSVLDEEQDDEPVMKALMEPDAETQPFGVMQSDKNTPSATTSTTVPRDKVSDLTPTSAEAAPSKGKYGKQLDKNKAQMQKNRSTVDNLALNLANADIISMQKRFKAEGLTDSQANAAATKKAAAKVKEYNRLAVQQFNESGAQTALSKERIDPSSGETVTGPVVSDEMNPNMTESMFGAHSGGYVPKTWGNLPRRILKETGEAVIEGGKRAIDVGSAITPASLVDMARGGEGYGTDLSKLSQDIQDEQHAAGDVVGGDTFGNVYTDAPLKAGVAGALELAGGKVGGIVAEKGLRGLAPMLGKLPMGGLLNKGAGAVDDLAAQYVKPWTDKAGQILNRPLSDLTGKKAAASVANQAGAVANAADEASLLRLQDKAGRMQSVQDMSEVVPDNPLVMPDGPISGPKDFASAIRGEIDDVSAQMVDPLKPAQMSYNPTSKAMTPSPNYHPELGPNGVKTLPMDPGTGPRTLDMPEIMPFEQPAVTKGAMSMTGPEASQVNRAAQLYENPANYPDPLTYGEDFASAVTQKAPLNRQAMKPFEGPTVQPQGMQQQMQVAEPPLPATKVLDPNRTMQMTESQIMGTDKPQFANALEEMAYDSGLPYKEKMSEMAGYQNARLNFLPGTRIEVPEATIGVAPELEKAAAQYGIDPKELFAIINKIDSSWLPKGMPMDTPEGAAAWIDAIWSAKGIDW